MRARPSGWLIAVHRRAAGGDRAQHQRRLGDPAPAAAVGLRDGDADPAAGGQAAIEVPRELVALIASRPVVVVEVGTHRRDGLGDEAGVVVLGEVDRQMLPRPTDTAGTRRHGLGRMAGPVVSRAG
jgi:hypothetical protein